MKKDRVYFKPKQNSNKIYSGVIWDTKGDFLTIGDVKNSNNSLVHFPPIMTNSTVVHKDLIII